MRGLTGWAIALRHPDGDIVVEAGDVPAPAGWQRRPFLRGLWTLGASARFGYRQLVTAAQVHELGRSEPVARHVPFVALGIALSVVIGLFVLLPLLVTGPGARDVGLPFRLAEGVLRFGLFAAYVAFVFRLPALRRVRSYHGAEHMAIHAFEAGDPLTTEAVMRHSPSHPRCGTAFLVIVFSLDMLVLALLPRYGVVPDLALRLVGLPLLAAVAYEVLRTGAQRRGIGSILNRAGMATQRLTTAPPSVDQVEVALAALHAALAIEGRALPASSQAIPTRPIPGPALQPRTEPVRHPEAAA
jgi:uncharacterized protein YqhQ